MSAAAEALSWRGAVRAGRGLVAGVVLFWLGAMFFVRGEEGVPTWWLPTALAVGFCLPWPPAPQLAKASARCSTRSIAGTCGRRGASNESSGSLFMYAGMPAF